MFLSSYHVVHSKKGQEIIFLSLQIIIKEIITESCATMLVCLVLIHCDFDVQYVSMSIVCVYKVHLLVCL